MLIAVFAQLFVQLAQSAKAVAKPNKGDSMAKSPTKKPSEELESDVSLLERLLDADNEENIFLFNEDGDEIELEQIAVVNLKNEIYAIMRPITAAEDEAVVFKIEADDEESIAVVEDEKLADEILEMYHKQAGII